MPITARTEPQKEVSAFEKFGQKNTLAEGKQSVSYKQRDYDAEARGKTLCALLAACLQSQGLLQYAGTLEEYKKVVKETAVDMMQVVFQRG